MVAVHLGPSTRTSPAPGAFMFTVYCPVLSLKDVPVHAEVVEIVTVLLYAYVIFAEYLFLTAYQS